MSEIEGLMSRYRGAIFTNESFSSGLPNYPFIGVDFVSLPGEGLVDIRKEKSLFRYAPCFLPELSRKEKIRVESHLRQVFKEAGITILTPTENNTSIVFFVPTRSKQEFLETIKALRKKHAQPKIA